MEVEWGVFSDEGLIENFYSHSAALAALDFYDEDDNVWVDRLSEADLAELYDDLAAL